MVVFSKIPWTAGRYVAWTALTGLLMVLGALLALYSLIDILRELRNLEEQYDIVAVLNYVVISTPRRLYEIFPFAALIGTLMGLGGLAATQELTALRAGGISRLKVAIMALSGGALLLAAMMLMTETVMPTLETQARADREQARRGQIDLSRHGGLWLRDGSAVMRIGELIWHSDTDMSFADIHLYELGADAAPERIIRARRAVHASDVWQLEEVRVQNLVMGADPAPRSLELLSYPSRVDPDWFDAVVSRPKFLAARDLARLAEYLESNGLDARPYRSAYWARVFYPLDVIAMMLIGLPFVFGPVRDRGWGLRVLTGIGLGLMFFMVTRGLQNAVYIVNIPLWLSSAIPPMTFITAALFLLKRKGSG